MRYTVIGMYTDNRQIFGTQVTAENPEEAQVEAVLDMLRSNGWTKEQASEIEIVAVFAGFIQDMGALETPKNGQELLGDSRWAYKEVGHERT